MEQKIKIFIIGLFICLGASILFNIVTSQSLSVKKQEIIRVSRERDELNGKFNNLYNDYKRIEEKANSLVKDLEVISKEKEELQNKYDMVESARQKLVEQLKAVKEASTQTTSPASEEAALPTDAYWANILKAKTNLELELENARNELKNLQINNEQLQREKSTLSSDLNNLNLEKQDLKRQLEYSKKQLTYGQKVLDNISLELVGEKNDKLQINDSLKAIKNENMVLRRQLKGLNNRKINLERKIQALQEENSSLQKKFYETDVLLKDKIIQMDTLHKKMAIDQAIQVDTKDNPSSSVELSPIVVRPQSANVSAATGNQTSGKIMAVNKNNNFVFVELCRDAGVKTGDIFKVYRDNNMVGTVEVMQVRQTISACDIKKEIAPLSVGDEVR